MFELRTLGSTHLCDPNGRVVAVHPKPLALLSYLTLAQPRGAHRRDTLLALLYPEHDHEHARASLRQLLRGLRTTAGDSVLQADRDSVRVDGDALRCDVLEFEAALAASQRAHHPPDEQPGRVSPLRPGSGVSPAPGIPSTELGG